MVLLEPTLIYWAPEIVPLTTTMVAVFPLTADWRFAAVLTVTVLPPAPPVVPPFCVAYPTEAASLAEARFRRGTASANGARADRLTVNRIANLILQSETGISREGSFKAEKSVSHQDRNGSKRVYRLEMSKELE